MLAQLFRRVRKLGRSLIKDWCVEEELVNPRSAAPFNFVEAELLVTMGVGCAIEAEAQSLLELSANLRLAV
jgi:hypothetical protein